MIILGIILAYLIVGTFLARQYHARQTYLAGSRNVTAELKDKQTKIGTINHASSCWRGPVHRAYDKHCDCTNRELWARLNSEIKTLEYDGIKINPPYHVVVGWPLVGFHHFITGGSYAPKGYDPILTARLEQEAGITELN